MKKYLLIISLFVFIISCERDTISNNNPFLPNYPVNYSINLNLPIYSNLQFPSNGVYINVEGVGIRGIFVFNNGSGFVAYDAACPNQLLSDCSTMTLSGVNAICSCDDASYNLFTGLANDKKYPMKAYRTEVNGSILRIFN
ncbi:MAG TPA: hypothetical protein DDZ41_06000 [Flavobacterium sp.]|nr:hypothetical protein [Flavobacterium sp.]